MPSAESSRNPLPSYVKVIILTRVSLHELLSRSAFVAVPSLFIKLISKNESASSNRINHSFLSVGSLILAPFTLQTPSPYSSICYLTFSMVSNSSGTLLIITPSQKLCPINSNSSLVYLSTTSLYIKSFITVNLSWCILRCSIIWIVDFLTFWVFTNFLCLPTSSLVSFLRYSCSISTGSVVFLFAIFLRLCRIERPFSSRYLIPLFKDSVPLGMFKVF